MYLYNLFVNIKFLILNIIWINFIYRIIIYIFHNFLIKFSEFFNILRIILVIFYFLFDFYYYYIIHFFSFLFII